jgi:hypothetical protein
MPSELAAALAKFQAALPRIAKDETANAGTYSYAYAGLDEVAARVLPALGKVGLSFTCFPTMDEGQFVLSYSLLHEGGEERTGTWPLGTGTPQQRGSAITYGRRYCLLAVTGVFPGGEDDDGEAAGQAQEAPPRVRNAHSDPEHVRLRQPPPEDYGRAQRTTGPIPAAEDRWDGQPAGEPLPEPEDRPGGMDGRQRARMFALFAETGLGGQDVAQRGYLTAALGHEIASRGALTYAEAEKAIRRLEEDAAAQKRPGSATEQQVGAIASLYASKLGFKRTTEKAQMLAASEQVIGRGLDGTHGNLSAAEARKLHDTLDGFADREALVVALAQGVPA